jgi:hypothetical protein
LVPILVVDLVLGVALVATVAIAASRSSIGASSERQRVLGWLLIALPLPLAVVMEVLAPLPPLLAETTFVAGVAAFAAGSLLVLRRDGGGDSRGTPDPETPPWWPEFEREFRSYARRSSRPRVLS